MKDIVANKSRLGEFETMAVIEKCNTRILKKTEFPTKLKDPRGFTIQVAIRNYLNGKRLYDLGMSINLMLNSMFRKLGVGYPKRIALLLQLKDHSVTRADEIIKDVLVHVGSPIFPVDFHLGF